MMLELVFYGPLADLFGREKNYEVPDSAATIADLVAALIQQFPDAAGALGSERMSFAVDDQIVQASHGLNGLKRIEFFPPVSGG